MRYYERMNDMPSEEDVAAEDHLREVDFDTTDPIDYEKMKSAIEEHGPIEIIKRDGMMKLIVNISPCQISGCNCKNDVISLTQVSGYTTLSTMIEKDALLENSSLDAFFNDFLHNPFAYYSSSGERQFIEREVQVHLGFSPNEVYSGRLGADKITASLSETAKSDFWFAHNLQGIFRVLLLQRLEINHFFREDYEEEMLRRFDTPEKFVAFLHQIYDLGFLTSRQIGEHFVREELEPLAERGVAAIDAQQRRNTASGKTANANRHKRILGMLEKMEALVAGNPALWRLGLDKIAELAIEDAALDFPALWTQGKGRRGEYLDELRSDIRYRERFTDLRKKTA